MTRFVLWLIVLLQILQLASTLVADKFAADRHRNAATHWHSLALRQDWVLHWTSPKHPKIIGERDLVPGCPGCWALMIESKPSDLQSHPHALPH